MKLDRLFGFLVPKDIKFFPLFREIANNLVTASELLLKLIVETNMEERISYVKAIKVCDVEGDKMSKKLLDELNVSFIIPFEREDILNLSNKMDAVVGHINSASKRIYFYNMTAIPKEFIQVADLMLLANKEIQLILENAKSVNDFKLNAASCNKIRNLGSQVDDICQSYLGNLFEKEANEIDFIKKRDILHSIEKAINKCEDVAEIFSTLIVKMG